LRGPLAKKAFRGLAFRFVKKEIELARGGVGVQLVIPSLLFADAKPLDDALVFLRGQTVDGGLDLLSLAHDWSLPLPHDLQSTASFA